MIIAPRADVWTTPTNELYGHGRLLRTFLGVLDDRVEICGEVQHGWSVGVATPMKAAYTETCPLFVWNDRSAAAARTQGVAHVRAIGAPLAYASWDIAVKREPGTVVALPQHATPGFQFLRARAFVEEYAIWLGQLRDSGGLVGSTICLHAHEYDDLAIRRACLRYGHKVVSCGHPFGSRHYLQDLLGYILSAEFVTSNAMSTPLVYAALAEKVVFVAGPVAERAPPAVPGEQLYPEATDPNWLRANFPEFLDGLDSRPVPAVGRRELGIDHRKTAPELWSAMSLMYTAARSG